MSNRTVRVNELVQRELSAILHQHYQSETVAVTITEVRVSPDLRDFVGLSLEYADSQMRYGPPSFVSTVKINQAGFHETMDTEIMFRKWFRVFQRKRLLPLPDHGIR